MSMADVLKIIEQGANIQLAFTTLISIFFSIFFEFFAIHISSNKNICRGTNLHNGDHSVREISGSKLKLWPKFTVK